ncbi:unnamed protein product [Tuwongella immobilis]|uniref:Carboxypeptidase regulatory-like domain-containing protein n=2 Tax=Tuwongella immobilis TaxID=692036 RepID=A0A6C2YPE1_9BACT|nr:unnamed protein product [Tuwongella immobilis]VTS04003.1 unnamed protein product [Tuwongella immobilis]
MTRLTAVMLVLVGTLVGCEGKPEMRSEPKPIQGKVSLASGKAPKGVTLSLQPMDNGVPVGMKVGADGSFSGQAIPGKYMFFFTVPEDAKGADRSAAMEGIKLIPEAYRSPKEANVVDVKSGSDIAIEVK